MPVSGHFGPPIDCWSAAALAGRPAAANNWAGEDLATNNKRNLTEKISAHTQTSPATYESQMRTCHQRSTPSSYVSRNVRSLHMHIHSTDARSMTAVPVLGPALRNDREQRDTLCLPPQLIALRYAFRIAATEQCMSYRGIFDGNQLAFLLNLPRGTLQMEADADRFVDPSLPDWVREAKVPASFVAAVRAAGSVRAAAAVGP